MSQKNSSKGQIAGGLGILAAVSVLCLKGMKKVDQHLKEKTKKYKK